MSQYFYFWFFEVHFSANTYVVLLKKHFFMQDFYLKGRILHSGITTST